MWEASGAWPGQLTEAYEAAQRAFGSSGPGPDAGEPLRAVVAFGLGAGGEACEAAAALTAGELAVPFVVRHDPAVPALVGPDCLVLAVACGDSPETVSAARRCVASGARVVGIGNEEELARVVAGPGTAWCQLGAAGPSARAAFGPATASVLGVLQAAGLVRDRSTEMRAAAAFASRRREAFIAERGTAAELARRIGRTIPLVYGSDGVAGVAARWWKSCVNLNAKSPAFAADVPALTYDELAGWGQGGDITRQTMTLVFLRHRGEPETVPALFEAVRAATDEVMADVLDVWADGVDDLATLFELALLGELVSLELAAREGVDPGPAPAVEEAHAVGR